MRNFNLVLFTTLLLTTSTVFAQSTDDGLDDFNIPGNEKSLDELVGPEPEISFPNAAKEPVVKDSMPEKTEPQAAAPEQASQSVVKNETPVEVPGVEWVRVVPDRGGLNEVSFEVPTSWTQKKGIWTVKKGDDIETGLKVRLTKFKEEDLAKAAKTMPEFSSSKRTINGNTVIVISSKRTIKKIAYTIRMAFYGAPMFTGKKQLALTFSSDNIKRDAPIFEHIMQTVKSSRELTEAAALVPKGQAIELVKTAPGEAEGAIRISDGYYKATLPGYKGDAFFAGSIDLNNDGKKEWFVQARELANCYGTKDSCMTYYYGHGPDSKLVDLGYGRLASVAVLNSTTNGYRDLNIDGKLYSFNGSKYKSGKSKEVKNNSFVEAGPAKAEQNTSESPAQPSAASSSENSSPARIDKPAQSAKATNVPGVEWVRVTSANKDLKGMSFEVPKNWPRIGDSDIWTKEAGSKIEVYLEVLSLRLKGMELAATKAHLKKFTSRKSVINGIHINVLTADNKHDGILYNENVVFFGENVSYTDGQVTLMFNTSNITRDGPIFQHILQSVRFGQKPVLPENPSQSSSRPDGPVSADGYSERHIGPLSFSLPVEWQKDNEQSNSVYFVFNSEKYSLEIFHTSGFHPMHDMVDERVPMVIAGRKAMRYEYGASSNRDVVIELNDVDSDGRRFSLTFTAAQTDWPEFQSVFERIVSSVRFAGSTARDNTDAKANEGIPVRNDRAYFFMGDQFIRYDREADKTDSGYPKGLGNSTWPGVWSNGIDAAVNWRNGKMYFFKGNQYIQFDIAKHRADAGYPKLIDNATWPGLWQSGVDAAVNWGDGKAIFFKDNQYILYDIEKDMAGPSSPRNNDESSWRGIWHDGIDAVVNWGNGKVYFFKGDEYIRFDIERNDADGGYPRNIYGSNWPGVSKGNIDAATNLKVANDNSAFKINRSKPILAASSEKMKRPLAENWQIYSNPRFGTSIDYPASLFTALPPPENGDGRKFTSRDGRTSFLIYGSNNALEQSIAELYGEQLASDYFDSILSKNRVKNSFTIRARSKDETIAQKVILDDSGVIHTFTIKYPETDETFFEPIIKRMMASFSAAPKAPETPEKSGSNNPDTGNGSSQAIELAFWQSIDKSDDPADFEAYLAQWPSGAFAVLAKNNLRRLQKPAVIDPTPELREKPKSAPRRSYYTPERNTRERKSIINAARILVSKSLGQKVIFVISVLRSDGRWAYLQAVPRRPNGRKLNWNTTPYASEWKNDAMSDVVMVLLRKYGGKWKAIDHVIGPTDVHWVNWLDQYGLPQSLFSAQ